ncbi:MAG: D-alanyl-D-alanine carboxypeptidase [Lachnospiraceae bacterium]|nr:D-alanyl-D-alanine carboxypeptidase [Lachnospiraceae bacterium]
MTLTGERCTNRLALLLILPLLLTGCGEALAAPYTPQTSEISSSTGRADFYASDLCVTPGDQQLDGVELSDRTCAGLFDVTHAETVYAKNVYERINPASLTKVMTALVALENGDLTKTIVAGPNVGITEKGAQKIGLKEGDRMTLDQALHILLIYSANDVANLIAESIAGSVDRFTQMMNDRAQSLGATGCHFTNPHGLTDDMHYVTTYDLYLIFYEAMQYREFRDIIDTAQYSSSYRTADGTEIPVDIGSTVGYLSGDFRVPEGVTVIGGKSGTTAAAGHCLILYLKDAAGTEYVSVVMRTPDAETLEKEMTLLMKNLG